MLWQVKGIAQRLWSAIQVEQFGLPLNGSEGANVPLGSRNQVVLKDVDHILSIHSYEKLVKFLPAGRLRPFALWMRWLDQFVLELLLLGFDLALGGGVE